MSDILNTQYFVSYTGMKLPLNLINPVDTTENRITFFRAHYDAQERMVLCEKWVYGEIEFSHQYTYYADGTLEKAVITNEDGVQTLTFNPQGQPLTTA